MHIAGADTVINPIAVPGSIALHGVKVLKFNDQLLQLSRFSRIEFQPGSGHHLLQLFTKVHHLGQNSCRKCCPPTSMNISR
jgi:hypothetical protein